MINRITIAAHLNPLTAVRRAFRLGIVILMFSNLVACAVKPIEPSESGPTGKEDSSRGLDAATDLYNSSNYPGAVMEFDSVIANQDSSANDRRLAHLGNALVFLGHDENWHSVENAKMSLMSAGQVAPAGSEKFAIETDMLMDAVSAVIGAESKYAALIAKSSGSGAQIVELRRELDALKKERNELLAGQIVLNEALEKLKKLSLGD